MKKQNLIIMMVFIALMGMSSCTKNDCSCTFYDKDGNELKNYNEDYEEMKVSSCSDLSTISEEEIGGGEAGAVCK